MRSALLFLALTACTGGEDAVTDSGIVDDSGDTEDSGTTDEAPTAAIEAPADGATVVAGTVALEGTVADTEDAAETLTVEWSSSIDGSLATPTPDTAGVVDISATLTAGSHTLTLSVTDSQDQTSTDTVDVTVEVPNTAPTEPGVSIAPAAPIEGTDALHCQITTPSTDVDADSITYSFTWEVDSAAFTGATGQNQYAGDQIAASNTYADQIWTCTVTADDGTDTSTAASASVSIGAAGCASTDTFPSCGGLNTDDASYDDGTSMGNNMLAFKQVASAAMDIQRVEFFTGEQTGASRVAIWSDSAGDPGAELAGASMQIESAVGWQGASFDDAARIGTGESYWVVWTPVNRAQASVQLSGTQVDYRGSSDGGTTWGDTYTDSWKFKAFCCE
ncbi:MAG: DUF4082 domain-containing protein [Proteobacteria bacterium]|nr:DUF4082 domain-containing protein [Pseudomonadota bacterium]